jgi:hypothetical protein
MENCIDVLESAADNLRIADIADHHFNISAHVRWDCRSLPMNLCRQVVQNSDPVPASKEFVGQMRANETGSASDQHLFTNIHLTNYRTRSEPES